MLRCMRQKMEDKKRSRDAFHIRYNMTILSTLSLIHFLTAGSMYAYKNSKSLKQLRVQGLCESIYNHNL